MTTRYKALTLSAILVLAIYSSVFASAYDLKPFANLAYPLEDAPGGKVILENGSFSAPVMEGSASKFEARLLEPAAISSWKGRKVAAVVLFYTEGGSGNFRRLYFLTKDPGQSWIPKAWTDLGDRIILRYVGLENHGQIVVGMIIHDKTDAACCPTKGIVRTYLVKGGKLLPSQTAPAHIFPDQVSFSSGLLGKNQETTTVLVPEHGFTAHGMSRVAPYPTHVAVKVNGKKILRIYPRQAYIDMWLAKKDLTIQIRAKRIERIIQRKDRDFTPPLPILPPRPGLNDLSARAELVSMENGMGIGFIGRVTKSLKCVAPKDLKYFFSGLATDGKYIVCLEHAISVKQPPEKFWDCQVSIEGLKDQITRVKKGLEAMDEEDFTPSLRAIKAFISSISIRETAVERGDNKNKGTTGSSSL